MKGLRLDNFKKIQENEHSAVLQHPSGHKITIAKPALSEKMKQNLASLPMHKFAAGGMSGAQPDMSANNPTPPPNDPDYQYQGPNVFDSSGENTDQVPSSVPPQGSMEMADQSPAPMAPQQGMGAMPQSDPYGMQGYGQSLQNSEDMQMGAARNLGKAQSDFAKAQVDLQAQHQKNLLDMNAASEKAHQGLLNERAETQKWLKDNPENQNRYFQNLTAPQKIGNTIALILGGLGSGANGGRNIALDIINKAVERDVDAQRAEIHKRENLLNANTHALGDQRDAANMMRLQAADLFNSKLQEAAAKSGSPEALARAQMFQGQLMEKYAPLHQQMVMRQAAMSPGAPIEMKINALVPPKDQPEVFKQLQMAQNHAKQTDVMLQAFDQSNKENTLMGRAGHLGATPASVAQLKTSMLPYLKDAEGRINEQELERTDSLIPAPGDSAKKISEKRQGLLNFIHEKGAFPLLKAHGIPIPGGSMYNEYGQNKIPEFSPKVGK